MATEPNGTESRRMVGEAVLEAGAARTQDPKELVLRLTRYDSVTHDDHSLSGVIDFKRVIGGLDASVPYLVRITEGGKLYGYVTGLTEALQRSAEELLKQVNLIEVNPVKEVQVSYTP